MRYREDLATARQRAEAARGLLDERGIPPQPENFTVWYDYAARLNPELCAHIDGLLAAGAAFDPRTSAQVYDRFYGAATSVDDDYNSLSLRVEAAAAEMLTALEAAGAGAEEYGAALRTFTGDLQGARSAQEFRALVTGLLSSTRAMGDRVNQLQSQLGDSTAEVSRLRDSLARARIEAMTDALTGVGNRHRFEKALEAATTSAREEGRPLSLIMLDLDHFKRVNDTYGHLIGDLVLKLVGQMLTRTIKGQDTAARYGGEEFAVILPNTQLSDAVKVAESIRLAVANKKIVRKGSGQEVGPITLSLGVALYRAGEPLADLIARADEALYAGKQRGRNQTVSELQLVAAA